MTGTPRSRELDLRTEQTGSLNYYWPYTANYYNSAYYGPKTNTDDVIGNWQQANPFDSIQRYSYSAKVNGTLYSFGRLARQFVDFPLDWYPRVYGSRSKFPVPNYISIAQEAVAKTNPSAPHVSVPTAVAELKDLPDLIQAFGLGTMVGALRNRKLRKELLGNTPRRQVSDLYNRLGDIYLYYTRGPGGPELKVGFYDRLAWARKPEKTISIVSHPEGVPAIREILRGLAMGKLTWSFGIAPMLSDLRKLFSFQKAVEKRFEYLEALRRDKVVRRRVGMGEDRITAAPVNRTVQSRGAIITAVEHAEYTLDTWATVKWQAAWEGVRPRFIENNWIKAKDLVLGITDYETFSTAWELIPWSWLTDWFTGYQTLITALNNSVGATPVEICYMETSTSRTWYDTYNGPAWTYTVGVHQGGEVRKTRTVLSPALIYFPTVSMPMLTHSQWSILGSLFTLAALRE